jgi:Ca2+-binding RTX toxin-like protein
LDGGSNTAAGDTVSFAGFIALPGATAGITVDLSLATTQFTGAGFDIITNFENAIGSDHDDNIIESADKNTLRGGLGNDIISLNGNLADVAGEVFDGGEGTDTLELFGQGNPSHNLRNDSITSIEALTLLDPDLNGSRTILLTASHFGMTGIASNAVVNLDIFNDTTETFDILMGTETSLDLADLAFANITTTARVLITGDADAETITGSAINDTIRGGAGGDNMNGGEGTDDTVDYTGSTSVNVNLFLNTATGGHATGDFISNFENVIGSSQSDTIAGDSNANILSGGLGTGDLITYASSNAFVNVNLTTNVVSGGFAQGDTISGFERVIGSAFDDFLAGTVFANLMAGGSGNDTIFGDAGADNLTGGNGFDTLDHTASSAGVTINLLTNTSSGGNAQGDIIGSFERVNGSSGGVDVLTGNTAANILRGNGGNDFIEGGAGADTLDGGAGSADTLVYTSSNAAVTVNIGLNTASGGHAQGDIISGFERLTGSTFGDTLTGTGGTNILKGGLGNDSLTGGAGFDTFVFDTAIGATNIDTITDFNVPQDTIQLDNLIFTALTDGALNATQFGFAATADTTDRIIYNQATGQLFYDTNGSTAGGSTQIATLATGLAMTSADFFVI